MPVGSDHKPLKLHCFFLEKKVRFEHGVDASAIEIGDPKYFRAKNHADL